MFKLFFSYIILLFFLCLSYYLVESNSIVGGWQQSQLPTGVVADIISINCMNNSTHCLAVGTLLSVPQISYVLMTKDGGFTWMTAFTLNAINSQGVEIVGRLYGISTFTSLTKVYAMTICTSGQVYVSTDIGNKYWNNTIKLPARIFSITSGLNGNGFIVGQSKHDQAPVAFLSSSTSSYLEWKQVNITSTKGNINALNGVNTYDGIFVVAVGAGPSIYYSNDSGVSWKSSSSSAERLCSGSTLYSVAIAPKNAFIIIAGTDGCVLKSINGSSWTTVISSYINSNMNYYFQAISIVNSDIYLGGLTSSNNNGIITHSYDSGNSWQLDFSATGVAVYSIYMTRQQTGITGLALTSNSNKNIYIRFPYPSGIPTYGPTALPSTEPSFMPTAIPSISPSVIPTKSPSSGPSKIPTKAPTAIPSKSPTYSPSGGPSSQPSSQPSRIPSAKPILAPTSMPSLQPIDAPTCQPFNSPTKQPSRMPSIQPSRMPSKQPTQQPVRSPSCQPTQQPLRRPTQQPSSQPTCQPSLQPLSKPSKQPLNLPSSQPSLIPSSHPISVVVPGVWFEIPKVGSTLSSPITTTVYYKSSIWISSQTIIILGGSLSSFNSKQDLGVILFSKNGGTTWFKSLLVKSVVFQELSFMKLSSNSYLVAVDNKGTIYSSVDNGVTWPYNASVSTVSSTTVLTSVTIGTTGIAFTVGGSKIFRSSDDSNYRTWTQLTNSNSNFDITTVQLYDVRMTRSDTVVIVGSGGFVGICTFVTSNNLIYCQQRSFASVGTTTLLFSLTFLDNLFGFVTGQDGSVLKTANGGSTWTKISSSTISSGSWNTGIFGRVISIVTQSLIFMVDSSGLVFVSKNGGYTWAKETTVAESGLSLYNINMRSSGYGIIGGSAGNIYLKTSAPSSQPSSQPYYLPSSQPTLFPNGMPTNKPSKMPTCQPSKKPSRQPSSRPSRPTKSPTVVVTKSPSLLPSNSPTFVPSDFPTLDPSHSPTLTPSNSPTLLPSHSPTLLPSISPTVVPSDFPTLIPSNSPTLVPSYIPTIDPTFVPSLMPSKNPSFIPTGPTTIDPTCMPSLAPSIVPSLMPSKSLSVFPSKYPTYIPSFAPTFSSSLNPTYLPSASPTKCPATSIPSFSAVPSYSITDMPSNVPIVISSTFVPTIIPSLIPMVTGNPTKPSSSQPSFTLVPTFRSTSAAPSHSFRPTSLPTAVPSFVSVLSFSESLLMTISDGCKSIDFNGTKAISFSVAKAMGTSPQYVKYLNCSVATFVTRRSLKSNIPVKVVTAINIPLTTSSISTPSQNISLLFASLTNNLTTSINSLQFTFILRSVSQSLRSVGTSSCTVISSTSNGYKVIALQPSYSPTAVPSTAKPTIYTPPKSPARYPDGGSSSALTGTSLLILIIVFSVAGSLLLIVLGIVLYCYLSANNNTSKEPVVSESKREKVRKESFNNNPINESKSDNLRMDKIYSSNKEDSFNSDSYKSPEFVSRKDLIGSKSTGSTNRSKVDIYYQSTYVSPSSPLPSPIGIRNGSSSKSAKSPEERSERKTII